MGSPVSTKKPQFLKRFKVHSLHGRFLYSNRLLLERHLKKSLMMKLRMF